MNLTKAKISMNLKQYTSAVKYFKEHLSEELCSPLNAQELNLLSEAYKNCLNEKQNCIWELETYLHSFDSEEDGHTNEVIHSMLDDMRNDLIAFCTDVVDVINGNLLPSVIQTEEIMLIYKMKGDFSRYKWEANNDKETCKEATKAYYEALSICQWNFESTNPYLLQVAMEYTVHLNNAGETLKSITILRGVINNAQVDLENKDTNQQLSMVELLLTNLNTNLQRFEDIFNRMELVQPIEFIDVEVEPEAEFEAESLFLQLMEIEDTPTDNSISRLRRYG